MNPFTERYKSSSNFELYRITKRPEDYQPDAVSAANTELQLRKLSTEERDNLKAELLDIQEQNSKKELKRRDSEDKAKGFAKSVLDSMNPVQETPPTAKKLILLLTLIFGASSIYKLYQGLPFLFFVITEGDTSWDFSMIEYFWPMLWLPIATVFFWLKKKWGWVSMSIFIAYTALNYLSLLIISWNTPSSSFELEGLLPILSPPAFAITTIVYLGFLIVLCRKHIREVFRVDKRLATITITFGLVVKLLMIYPYI